jgi:hypothetical protein
MSQENVEITRRANEVLARNCLCRVAIGCNRRMVALGLDESQDRLGANAVVLHCFCCLVSL